MAGLDHFFDNKADAIAWTAAQLASGERSIDVGCFQINLKYHPDAFATLEEAFDPASNARYAGKFLIELFHHTASWKDAAADYHSLNPILGEPYGQHVFAILDGGDLPSALVSQRLGRSPFGIQVIVPDWATVNGEASQIRFVAAKKSSSLSVIQFISQRNLGRNLPRVFTPSSP